MNLIVQICIVSTALIIIALISIAAVELYKGSPGYDSSDDISDGECNTDG